MAVDTQQQKGIVEIDQVPKDFNPEKVVYFTNIMNKVWDGYVNGRKYHLKQNETKMVTEPVAHCLAEQLANFIIFGEEDTRRKAIRVEKGEDAYIEECRKDTGLARSRFDELIKRCLLRPPKDKDLHLSDPVEKSE